jgi:hypothetical protein
MRRPGCLPEVAQRKGEKHAFLYAFDLVELNRSDLRRSLSRSARRRWRASCARAALKEDWVNEVMPSEPPFPARR